MAAIGDDILLQHAVDGIYEAVAAPETWRAVLDICDKLFNANSAHLFLWDDARKARVAADRSSSFADNHPEWDHFHKINPRRKILSSLPTGTPMNCADHIDDSEVARSEYFNDYSLPAGRRYLLGTYAYKENSVTTAFAVMRPPGKESFGNSDKRLLAQLIPHLARAARIDRRLRAAREEGSLVGTALDRLADAVVVVDATGRVVRANLSAQGMMQSGGLLCVRAGRLQAANEAQSVRLLAMITDAARPAAQSDASRGGTLILDDPSDPRRWAVLVAPLMPSAAVFDLRDRRLVIVIASKVNASRSVEHRLNQAFALTPAEARLAARLAAGATLEQTSDALDVQLTTLRTQLKIIFQKTDTRRQGELMQLTACLDRLRDES